MAIVFKYLDYRKFIKDFVEDKRKRDRTYHFSFVAEKIGIQKGLLARALQSKAELMSDQIYKLSELFELEDEETEYFLTLHEMDRTALPARRKRCLKKVVELRKKHLSAKDLLDVDVVTTVFAEPIFEYYLDPNQLVAHVLLGIPDIAGDPSKLTAILQIDSERLRSILLNLQKLGIVKQEKSGYQVLKHSLHLPKESFLIEHFQTNTRLRSLMHMQRLPASSKRCFNFTFTASPEAFEKIALAFLKFIESTQQETLADEPRVGYQLNFDLFKWTP